MNRNKSVVLALCYVLPLSFALLGFISCVMAMAGRISYPYELEWIEGGMLQPVVRILQGLPMYVRPTMEYAPPLYAPLFFYLSAFAALFTGENLLALRVVSVFSALMSAVLLFSVVLSLTKRRLAALLAVLGWGALYRLSGFWFDVGRVDSLWTFGLTACVATLFFSARTNNRAMVFLAAFFLFFAVFAKQTSLVLLLFMLSTALLWLGFARFSRIAVVFLMMAAIGVAFFQWQTAGLFWFYLMDMGRAHKFNSGLPLNFLNGDLLHGVPVLVCLSIYFLFHQWPDRRWFWGWVSLFVGFMLMTLLSRWYSGGSINVLMPLHIVLLIMGISGFSFAVDRCLSSSLMIARYLVLPLLIGALTYNLSFGQFSSAAVIPTSADRECGDRLVKQIAAVEGAVCSSRHAYLVHLAGKPFCAHEAFAVDILNGSSDVFAEEMKTDVRKKLHAGYYSTLIMDSGVDFSGYGMNRSNLAYTISNITCGQKDFYPVGGGPRPIQWLEYNGTGWIDKR